MSHTQKDIHQKLHLIYILSSSYPQYIKPVFNIERTILMEKKLVIFGWNNIIVSHPDRKLWKMIGRICGADGRKLYENIASHPELRLIDNKNDFIEKLDQLISDTYIRLPADDNGYEKVTGIDSVTATFPKASHLYNIYRIVSASRPYMKDVASLIDSLPENGISTALLSDICFWELERQGSALDMSRLSFKWQSCFTHISKKNPDSSKAYQDDILRTGVLPENVLLIDNDPNAIRIAGSLGWNAYLDDGFMNAESIKSIISKFTGRPI